jgi:hypothetical protein
MANEWEVERTSGRCAVSGQVFAEGDAYYTVLLETPEGFERRDYGVEAWTGPPEGSFCYWRGRVPVREKKRANLAIDPAVLAHLFLHLEDEDSESKQQFRFVLALLLMRKRLLKFEQTVRRDEREYWQMRLLSDQSVHQILNPRLTDEQVDRLGEQLNAILSGVPDEAIEILDRPAETDTREAGEGPEPDTVQ